MSFNKRRGWSELFSITLRKSFKIYQKPPKILVVLSANGLFYSKHLGIYPEE